MVAVADPTGMRSANLVWDYSLMLSMVPIAAWAGGLTSSMFAIEGTAVNAYLLYLAHQFRKEGGQSNANARRVFLCSLWYLPLLMTAMVFHCKNWKKDEIDDEFIQREGLGITSIIQDLKSSLKELCVHEVAVEKMTLHNKQDGRTNIKCIEESKDGTGPLPTDSNPTLCPKPLVKVLSTKAQKGLDSVVISTDMKCGIEKNEK